MSSSSPPPDNSYAVAQLQAQQAAQAKSDADAKAASDQAALDSLRQNVRGQATGTVDNYFTSRGVDPSQYSGDIESQLNNILSGIATSDPNPGSSFSTAGSDIFNDLTSSTDAKANAALNQIFNPTYATDKVTQSLADPYIQSLQQSQRASADQIVQNMLKRGVLTQSGYNAAEGDLDKQAAGVNTTLKGFGQSVLAGGQQSLNDIINGAHQTASGLQLGQTFDPSSYSKTADQTFNDFVNSLGDQINAKVGNSNLFQTNGLAAIGGAAQGAGNTAYDPNAAAGILNADDQTNPKPTTNSQTENVF